MPLDGVLCCLNLFERLVNSVVCVFDFLDDLHGLLFRHLLPPVYARKCAFRGTCLVRHHLVNGGMTPLCKRAFRRGLLFIRGVELLDGLSHGVQLRVHVVELVLDPLLRGACSLADHVNCVDQACELCLSHLLPPLRVCGQLLGRSRGARLSLSATFENNIR